MWFLISSRKLTERTGTTGTTELWVLKLATIGEVTPCGSVLACRMSGALGSIPNIEWNKHKGYYCLSCHALTDRPSLKEERLSWILPEELQSPLPRFTSPETGWASNHLAYQIHRLRPHRVTQGGTAT